MANALTPLFEHNYWANLLLLEACSGLKEEQLAVTIAGVYGTPAATLVHYLSGEQTYIRRLSGEEQPQSLRGDAGWPGLEALVEHARWSGDRLRRLAETIEPATVIRESWDGVDYEIDGQVVLVQAINHSTEHRAHIVTTLSAHGIALPEIDGWNWGEATGRLRPSSH
ncbi:MAG TPA: DinB family protein [Tepidiformaceae bacterium]|jgi:uncharacterized damage-inducible protein DinB